MAKKKEFSALKWILFPLTSLCLAAVIANFNYQVFGKQDGLPYVAVVALITFFAIVICKYTGVENRGLSIGAFVCEVFLFIALMVNAAWSLSVQRSMSVARLGEAARSAEMKEIRQLDRRAQRDAVRQMGKRGQNAQDTFAQYESVLYWIMLGELALYGICAFSLFGLAQIVERSETAIEARAETREPVIKPTVKWQGNRIVDSPQRINGEDKSQSH